MLEATGVCAEARLTQIAESRIAGRAGFPTPRRRLILSAECIEFDSNAGSHVWLKQIGTASFDGCRFISHYASDTKRNLPGNRSLRHRKFANRRRSFAGSK